MHSKYELKNEIRYYVYDEQADITFDIKGNSSIFIYAYDTDINVVINLEEEYANVEFHYSTINKNDHYFKIEVNHKYSNTTSNIYNHGINTSNNSLSFDVTGIVPKTSEKCVVNQENQIINLNDGKGTILPNLLIDNYDITSSHSAYIGSFKEDKLYYLMSRGISRKDAIKLLMESLLINNGDINNGAISELLLKIENL